MRTILSLLLSLSISPIIFSSPHVDDLRTLSISNTTGVENILTREDIAQIHSHFERLRNSAGNHTGSGGGGEALLDYAIPVEADRCLERETLMVEHNSTALSTLDPSQAKILYCEQAPIKYYVIQESDPDINYSYTDRGYDLNIVRSKLTWNNRPTHLIRMNPWTGNYIEIYLQEIENCSLDRKDRSSLLRSLAKVGVDEYIESSRPEEIIAVKPFAKDYEKDNIGVVFTKYIYNKVYALDAVVTSKRFNHEKCFRARAKTRVHGNGVIIKTINEILSSVSPRR